MITCASCKQSKPKQTQGFGQQLCACPTTMTFWSNNNQVISINTSGNISWGHIAPQHKIDINPAIFYEDVEQMLESEQSEVLALTSDNPNKRKLMELLLKWKNEQG